MTITIYHNPKCGTSRNTLAMIRASGEQPEVIEYLKNPPTRERLTAAVSHSDATTQTKSEDKPCCGGTCCAPQSMQ